MTYSLTYLYLFSFVIAFGVTVAVAVGAPRQPAKASLVAVMATVSLWALASFLMNLAVTRSQMLFIGDLFAVAWCALPYLLIRSALQYARDDRRIRPAWLSPVLALPVFFALYLKWWGYLGREYVPAWQNGGAFDLHPTAWSLPINLYFLVYSVAAAYLLWRQGALSDIRRLRRTGSFFLMLVLPAVLIGSWSSGGLALVDWRPPFLDSVVATAVVATLGRGMLRADYFEPWAAAEAARFIAEDRLRKFMLISPDCLIVFDSDGRFRLLNQPAAQLFGYADPGACIDAEKPIGTFVPKPHRHLLLEMRSAAIAGEEVRGIPLPIIQPGGERIETEVSLSVLRSSAGEPEGFVAALRDVSERQRLEEGMRQAQKLESLGLLASGIAHDFNNLLSVVIGSSDLALADCGDNPKVAHNIQQTLRGAKHLSALTRELLVYSGRARQVVGPLSLSMLVKNISGLIDVSLPRNVELSTSLADGLPSFAGDATQIQQVVLNLITNAAEACAEANLARDDGEGGVVYLATYLSRVEAGTERDAGSAQPVPPGEYLCLKVRDEGPGISDQIQEKIFDPFFTSKVAGRGLGLSAVLGIVRDHGGFTLLETAPGQGTTFRVLLPPGKVGKGRVRAETPAEEIVGG